MGFGQNIQHSQHTDILEVSSCFLIYLADVEALAQSLYMYVYVYIYNVFVCIYTYFIHNFIIHILSESFVISYSSNLTFTYTRRQVSALAQV